MGSLSFTSIVQNGTTVALDAIASVQDWSAWASTSSPPTPTDHRNGGGSTITLAFFGTAGGYTGYSGAAEVRQISWTNGTNTASSNFTSCIYPGTNGTVVNNGFKLTFPADTNARSVKIFCGPYNCIGGVSASLSDGSAASISDTTSMTGSSGVINDSTVTIAYQANSAAQTLTVNIFYAASGGFAGGFITLQAAAHALASAASAPFVQREDLGRIQQKGVYSDFQPSNFPLRIPAAGTPLNPLEMGVALSARGIYTDFVPLNFPTRLVPPPPVKSVDLGSAISLRGVFSDFVPANIAIQVAGPGPFIAADVSGVSPRPGLIDFAVPNFLAKAAAVTPLVPADATMSIRARGTFTDFSPPNLSLSTLASPLAPLRPQDNVLRLEYRWIRGDDLPVNRRTLTQSAVTPLAPQDLSGMRVEAKAVRSDFAPPNLTLFLPIPPPPPVSSPAGRHGTRAQARKRRERDVLRAQIEAFKERRKEAEANLIAMEDREVQARAKVLKRVKVKSADLTRGPTKPLEQYAPVKRAIAQRNDALAIYRDILTHLDRAHEMERHLREREDEEAARHFMEFLQWEWNQRE